MKTIVVIFCAVGLAVAIGFYATRDRTAPAAPVEPLSSAPALARDSDATDAPAGEGVPAPHPAHSPAALPHPAESTRAAAVPSAVVFNQALDTLLSPNASFQEKQIAWGQLRNSGKLDPLIAELEDRAVKNPGVSLYPAALGQAYLQKAGTIQDIREQGILGMKADQSFEAALNSDPQNWDARFWKTTALSYWPRQLGKGTEVIQNCLELLKQQEVQPPRPEFAHVYVLLGDMYEREGNSEYAQQAWKRGQGLFPNHEALAAKISAPR